MLSTLVGSGGWEFRDPLFLLVGLAAPIVYWLAARVPSSVTYSSLDLPDAAIASPRVYLAKLPAILLAIAAVLMAMAMAGPRTGDATTKVKRDGVALIMAMDRSGSMDARDFVADDYSVSRLSALKEVFREFVVGGDAGDGRPNDLIGIVAFGTFADGICPLTLDHGNLVSILDDIEIAKERSEAATALGEGLGLAIERLRKHPAKSKIVILLTDGVNNAGELDPLQAADLASANDIKVYTIGAGITGYAPMPVQMSDGRISLRRSPVEIDEETLREIAARTGGRYFHAKNADGLKDVYREIDRLERSEITEIRYLQYREHYHYFILAALLLIVVSAVAGGTFLRRLP